MRDRIEKRIPDGKQSGGKCGSPEEEIGAVAKKEKKLQEGIAIMEMHVTIVLRKS